MDQIIEQLQAHLRDVELERAHILPMYTDDEYDHALLGDTWQDLEIEVTLDSGCVEHVCDAGETPGYSIVASPGSKRRQNFIVGNGHKIPNQGEVHLNLEAGVGGASKALAAVVQVAAITRPLMSVSKICDQDLICTFDKERARVTNSQGGLVCEFVRQGGLYVATMRLKRPTPAEPGNATPFPRPER